MILEHLVVPEVRECLQKNGGMLKDHRTQSEGDPNSQSCNNVMWEEKKREREKQRNKEKIWILAHK